MCPLVGLPEISWCGRGQAIRGGGGGGGGGSGGGAVVIPDGVVHRGRHISPLSGHNLHQTDSYLTFIFCA